jgi:serine/threonine protein kinase
MLSAKIFHEINDDDISGRTFIGKGLHGYVEKACWGYLPVAIKYLHNSRSNDSVKWRTKVNDIKNVFGGDHIIGVYGITTNRHGNTGIVMEYCAKGTLRNYLESTHLGY